MDLEKEVVSHLTEVSGIKTLWDQGVREEHFFDPVNKAVFSFSMGYWDAEHLQKAPSLDVLSHEFPSLAVNDPQESPKWAAKAIRSRYVRSEFHNLIREGIEESDNDPYRAVKGVYETSWEVIQKAAPRVNRSNMATSIQSRRERYIERANNKGDIKGAPVGLGMVDEHLSGIFLGELAVVAGYAKVGKSHFLCNSVKEARKAGWTPYFASLELPVKEMEDRMDCHISGVGANSYLRGELSIGEIDRLAKFQEEFAEYGDVFIEKPPMGERSVNALVRRARQLGADFLVIDQFSFIEPRNSKKEKRYEYEEIMEDLKNEISEDESNSLSCLMAVQFNRDSKSAKSGRGGMHHIAASSAIERYSDTIFGLHSTEEMRVNNSIVAEILGGRRSPNGAWLLEWELGDRTAISVREEYED